MLRLIKLWLKAPIEERDGDGKRRMRFTACSEPPMFQETVHVDVGEQWGLRRRLAACRGRCSCHHSLAWTKAVMERLGLMLNDAKTSLKNARRERFDFPATRSDLIATRGTANGI